MTQAAGLHKLTMVHWRCMVLAEQASGFRRVSQVLVSTWVGRGRKNFVATWSDLARCSPAMLLASKAVARSIHLSISAAADATFTGIRQPWSRNSNVAQALLGRGHLHDFQRTGGCHLSSAFRGDVDEAAATRRGTASAGDARQG
eukprot:scaffold5150_cov376-Prasinococcus_capsulatus_cf.AAC.6